MCIQLVVDVSASMYCFNGYDSRVEGHLEASLMIMEGLRDDNRFQLGTVGHSGSNAKIPFLNCEVLSVLNEHKYALKVPELPIIVKKLVTYSLN